MNFCDLAVNGVQSLKPYEPGKPVSDLQRELGLTRISKLASNENALGPGAMVKQAIKNHLDQLGRYPDGNGFALKQALADRHSIAPECITLGNGSNDILELIARVFLKPGRNAVFSQYSFAVYPLATQAVGAQSHIVPANPRSHEMPLGHDLPAMLNSIGENTQVVFIANPNNPTGTWLDTQTIRTFLDSVPEHVVVVVDEAYFEYVIQADHPDVSQWVHDYQNLVVTRTFSKAFGLAGLRVGYSISSAQIADLLNRVRQPFNVNHLAQVAAITALEDHGHLSDSIQNNIEGMQQISTAMIEMGLSFLPSRANFLCIDFQKPTHSLNQELLKKGVIVRPVENYGLANYLRVSIGTPSENQHFIETLHDIYS